MALDLSNVKVEVAVPAGAFLGEGPHWDADRHRLLWVDIYKPAVHVFDPTTNKDHEFNIGEKLKELGQTGNRLSVGAVVPFKGSSSKLLLATGGFIAAFDLESGNISPLSDIERDKPGNRFNDGKCDPEGRFWAGTMSEEGSNQEVTPDAGSLYMMPTGQQPIKTMFTKVSISNGLAWSNDSKTMYYIDSDKRCIYAFDYNRENGDITNSRILINHDEKLGLPDGMAIDSVGRLWVAGFRSGQVHCYDPLHPEKVLGSISIPDAKFITSCCFGGENLDELYVTSATIGKDTQKFAGHLFRVTGLGAQGHYAG